MSCDVSRLRYRGDSVLVPVLPICPASRPPSRHLMLLAWLADIRPACRLACRPVVISSAFRHLVSSIVPSSNSLGRLLAYLVPLSHPSSLTICLLAALCPALRLASRLVRSSRFPWEDVIDALPDRSPCRSVCGHQSPRPACRMAGSGTERGAFIVIVRPPCRCCLLALAWERLRLFRLRRSACSVGGSICAGIVVAKLYI